MRFTPQFLEELRARLPVSEVVGRRVKLKRAGKEYKGLSPFQQEKTPSFTVNDQKQFYHDFSSGKHGNIFDFVMETEGVSFPEAVERLASMAGVPLPAVTPDAARHEQRRKTLYDVMELAAKFFADTLASRNGAKARGYLGDRAISPAMQVQFRLGYAAGERFALKEHLGAHGIPVEDMVEAGLLVRGDDIPVPYDRFRDRVMFPITDLRGRVIAFGGRALEKDVPAKYLNSPETPLFHKGDNLYNLATARQAAHDGAPHRGGRRLCRRHRHGRRGLCGKRRAARHGAHRKPARAAVEDGGRADPLFRRRPRRAEGGVSRRRPRAAAAQAGQESALRAAARRTGPRRSRALRRPRRDRGSHRRRARACRHDLVARDRGRQLCHARAPRGAGGADRRTHQRHPRRGGAALLSPGSGRAAGADLCAGSGARRLRQRQFSRRQGRRITPPFRPPRARRRGADSAVHRGEPRPSPAAPTRRPAPSWRSARSCAASAARCPAARR